MFDTPSSVPHTATAAYTRATGPKSVHAPRTLHFLPPDQYKMEKREQRERKLALLREYMSSGSSTGDIIGESAPEMKSFLAMKMLEFGERGERNGRRRMSEVGRQRRASFGNSTTRYHSLADGIGGRSQLPRKRSSSLEIPFLPMNVLKSPHKTPSPVHS